MPRRVFFSFDYDRDVWRAAQVKNMGIVDGDRPAFGNEWEEVKRKGDVAIKQWIDRQMEGRTCCVVLIGAETYKSRWVRYEIARAWNRDMGVFGIYVHGLKDRNGQQSVKGQNPFDYIQVKPVKGSAWLRDYTCEKLSDIVYVEDPPYTTSQNVYDYIKQHLVGWIDTAILLRGGYRLEAVCEQW